MKMLESYNLNPESEIFTKSSGLLLVMEKLYVWEKRLYLEIKNEENLRARYNKECKRLKQLDDRGAEPYKIDATQSSIKRLLPKINVAVTAINVISGRIHKLRDEELLPQVNELIHGLIRVWKLMSECHKKQLQAIMEAEINIHMHVANASTGESSLNATRELEMEILTWGARFSDLISIQKEFVKSLSGWLRNCISHEPEETPDGITPISPGKMGAPPIFIICNDWNNSLDGISGTKVLKTIHEFASFLHQFVEMQNESRPERIQAEYCSKVTMRRLKSLCKMSKIKLDQDALSSTTTAFKGLTECGFSQSPLFQVLNAVKEVEQNQMHDEVVRNFSGADSSRLKKCLISIFEALEVFSLDTSKAYEQIRVSPMGDKNSE